MIPTKILYCTIKKFKRNCTDTGEYSKTLKTLQSINMRRSNMKENTRSIDISNMLRESYSNVTQSISDIAIDEGGLEKAVVTYR